MIKVLHIITGLEGGGAENMLAKILECSNKNKYHHHVISLKDNGIYGSQIQEYGISVTSLNLRIYNAPFRLIKVRKMIKEFDVVNTWLYHADFFGYLSSKFLNKKKLIWNIRQANIDQSVNTKQLNLIIWLNSKISKNVDSITFNSLAALESHREYGFDVDRARLLPNGFDLNRFDYSESERIKYRNKLQLNNFTMITVGRWDVQKDYETLLKALAKLTEYTDEFTMLMVGENLDSNNNQLLELIKNYNLKPYIKLLGRREDIPSLLSAADLYISSSLGESFSNSIGEAMACELACVVTNVGDSKTILGDTGFVVESGDYVEMANRMKDSIVIGEQRNKPGRRFIEENYSIENVVSLYEEVYEEVAYRDGTIKVDETHRK